MKPKPKPNGENNIQQEIIQEPPDFQQSETQLVITTMEEIRQETSVGRCNAVRRPTPFYLTLTTGSRLCKQKP